ncbi:MAG: hypothetical protein NTX50_04910 [Candidatus Sumerlaeota bacterium]|nr:hypothetical protein [Candidatus Sumerlaeota bacterium]
MIRNLLLCVLLAAALIGAAGCAPKDDRAYLSPARFEQAQLLYDAVGSLKLTKEILADKGWTAAQIRQAEYQLIHEQHLDTPNEPRQ